jgi:3-hydroxyacyl-CoA dehydrogenase / enoyl-CoA hydratase / 3-hydroxybutyryl-CoA epimerase
MIRYQRDTNNIVTLSLDMQGSRTNLITHELGKAFVPVLQHLLAEKAKGMLKGVILTSAKKSFLVGGDPSFFYESTDPQEVFAVSQAFRQFLRDLERPGVPVVSAINGDALGAGYEVALACHYRIALTDNTIRLGLPDIELGLLPYGGSSMRLMWLLGLEKAYDILSRGRRYTPQEALSVGLIDALADNRQEMIDQAKQWLLQHPDHHRPWDDPQQKIPGGTAREHLLAERIRSMAAGLCADSYGNYPALQALLATLTEGSKVDFDTANRIDNRHFVSLVCGQVSKNMIHTFHFDRLAIAGGLNRPKGFGRFRPRKAGIIGAGQMGSGIAFACLRNGMSVVLKDVSKPIAVRGLAYVQHKLRQHIQQGSLQAAEGEKLLKHIRTTEDAADFTDCDIVIEAVFENAHVKQKVTREAEEQVDEYCLLGTNTISIPIGSLARDSVRPQNYLGLHFFHPADEVPLVEIVRGEHTSDESVAKAFDFVHAIGKIPIIVKDGWGFYAARVQNTYVLEGITLLQQGLPPALIENIGVQLGMPKGPLAMADETGLELLLRYEQQAADHYGDKYLQHPAVSAIEMMVNELKRPGRHRLAGFYEYADGQPRQLWPGLGEHFPVNPLAAADRSELADRLLFAQVVEALWCKQEGVILSDEAANLGSIYGWGFPAYTGGVIQFVRSYGLPAFVDRCRDFRKRYGQRYRPPKNFEALLSQERL